MNLMISPLFMSLLAAPTPAPAALAQDPPPEVQPPQEAPPEATPAQSGDDDQESLRLIPKCDGDEIVLPSGVKYCVLSEGGQGAEPQEGDLVLCDYTGWTASGKLFDSSRIAVRPGSDPGPTEFHVGLVIPGWTEALQLMTPGDRWLVSIPAAEGYGARGTGDGTIPPDTDLVFDVELLEVVSRVPRFQEWNAEAEDIVELESGVQLRVIDEGSGKSAADGMRMVMDSCCYDEKGRVQFFHGVVSTAPPAQLGQVLPPWRTLGKDGGAVPFMKDLAAYAKTGATLQVNVPGALGLGSMQREKSADDEIWMVSFPRGGTYEKPEFDVPADEELTTTESGLRYRIDREGTGRKPRNTSIVVAHYTGWLTNGSQFDSSHDRGAPSAFSLRGVVSGWTEGVPLVGIGGSITLVVPAELGYGARGRPGIPANSELVFKIDLMAAQ